jgi:hypothetical protein
VYRVLHYLIYILATRVDEAKPWNLINICTEIVEALKHPVSPKVSPTHLAVFIYLPVGGQLIFSKFW